MAISALDLQDDLILFPTTKSLIHHVHIQFPEKMNLISLVKSAHGFNVHKGVSWYIRTPSQTTRIGEVLLEKKHGSLEKIISIFSTAEVL